MSNNIYDSEETVDRLTELSVKSVVNLYACENVCFGKIGQNEKVPLPRYLDELGLSRFYGFEDFDGSDIEGGLVKERDFDERCFDLYRAKVRTAFSQVPVDERFTYDGTDIGHYKFGLYDYLKELYPLFRQIVATEVVFECIATAVDKKLAHLYRANAVRFVLDIKLKGLKKGSAVDEYVKSLPFIPILIGRLVSQKDGKYYLKNDDTDSSDYKFALFSCFGFYSADNFRLFECKMLNYTA